MKRAEQGTNEEANWQDITKVHLPSFPYYGFHWRINDKWLDTQPNGDIVDPLFVRIWETYLRPTHSNLVRFHIDVMAWEVGTDSQYLRCNARMVERVANFCRFAVQQQVKIVPMLMGSGRYSPGKEWQFGAKLRGFLHAFIKHLQVSGQEALYHQIALFQIEDEMNHPVRHARWSESTYVKMLIDGCRAVRETETITGLHDRVPTMVIFPSDLMFVYDLLHRPTEYLSAMKGGRCYQLQLPSDLLAFLASEFVDVIGIDMYPGLYAPFATPHTLLQILEYLCQNYGQETLSGKRFLLAEAGYATWPYSQQRELRQLDFFETTFRLLSEYFWQRGGRECGFLGLLWYCFNDQHIRPVLWPPQEYRFGVLKTVPQNEWFATYPSKPKSVWYWLCTHVQPYSDVDATDKRESKYLPGSCGSEDLKASNADQLINQESTG